MGDAKSLAHTKWNCKYHIVFGWCQDAVGLAGDIIKGKGMQHLEQWRCCSGIEDWKVPACCFQGGLYAFSECFPEAGGTDQSHSLTGCAHHFGMRFCLS